MLIKQKQKLQPKTIGSKICQQIQETFEPDGPSNDSSRNNQIAAEGIAEGRAPLKRMQSLHDVGVGRDKWESSGHQKGWRAGKIIKTFVKKRVDGADIESK